MLIIQNLSAYSSKDASRMMKTVSYSEKISSLGNALEDRLRVRIWLFAKKIIINCIQAQINLLPALPPSHSLLPPPISDLYIITVLPGPDGS